MEVLTRRQHKPHLSFSLNWIGALVFLAVTESACALQLAALSVCEVVKDLSSYSDKLIAVSGNVYIGAEIFAIGRKDCEPGLVTLGHKWPSAIDAADPPSQTTWDIYREHSDPRSVEFMNLLSRALVHTYWMKYPVEEPPFEVSATFVGILRTRELIRIDSSGKSIVEGGFGHLNTYPAKLEVVGVRDILVKQKPTPTVAEKPKPVK